MITLSSVREDPRRMIFLRLLRDSIYFKCYGSFRAQARPRSLLVRVNSAVVYSTHVVRVYVLGAEATYACVTTTSCSLHTSIVNDRISCDYLYCETLQQPHSLPIIY